MRDSIRVGSHHSNDLKNGINNPPSIRKVSIGLPSASEGSTKIVVSTRTTDISAVVLGTLVFSRIRPRRTIQPASVVVVLVIRHGHFRRTSTHHVVVVISHAHESLLIHQMVSIEVIVHAIGLLSAHHGGKAIVVATTIVAVVPHSHIATVWVRSLAVVVHAIHSRHEHGILVVIVVLLLILKIGLG